MAADYGILSLLPMMNRLYVLKMHQAKLARAIKLGFNPNKFM